MTEELFKEFVREKRFLEGLSEKTLYLYECAWKSFRRSKEEGSRDGFRRWVMSLKEGGMKGTSINAYIRGMNSFFAWLFDTERAEEQIRLKYVKDEQPEIKKFTDEQMARMLAYRPTSKGQKRMFAIVCLLMDTGIRIEEALTLTRDRVDLDNLLIHVHGKGKKDRVVPISRECRKVLYRHLRSHSYEYVFCSRNGDRLVYRNCLRDFKLMAQEIGVEGVRVSFHTLRHAFALNYVKHGGSLFHLQKALGHTTLQMTRRYCELTDDDMRQMHQKVSSLERLKRR